MQAGEEGDTDGVKEKENPPSPGHAAITISTCKLPETRFAPDAL
jgi:hypothetical protein